MGGRGPPSREHLITKVWPDKALYGSVLLFVTGLAGLGFAIVRRTFEVGFSENVPPFLIDYPGWLTVTLCVAAFGFAYWCQRTRNSVHGIIGSVCGIASLGLLGVGSILSLWALAYLLWSKAEKEDTTFESLRLTSDMWPDKSLAAALLMLINGIATSAWAILLLTGTVTVQYGNTPAFEWSILLVGLVELLAAFELYLQRIWWVAALAAIGGVVTASFYVVGPVLSLAVLVLMGFALKEREFSKEANAKAATMSTKPARP